MLRIYPYQNISLYTGPKKRNQRYNQAVSTQFQSVPVSFKGYDFPINLTKGKSISATVKSALLDSKNFLGQGSEGIVYRLPNTDYCVKIPHIEIGKDFGGWTFNIGFEDKVNHVVARSENNTRVMNFIEGSSLKYDNKPKEIYSLPLESYRDFVKQISDAADNVMQFDSAPSTIIFNKKEKTFTAIDFRIPNVDYDFIPAPFTSVYRGLQASKEQEKSQSLNKNLMGRLLQTALEEIKKGKDAEFAVEDGDIKELFYCFENGQDKLEPQYKFLKNIFSQIFLIKKVEARGINISEELNGKIKYAECIIKQILIDK